MPFQWDVARVTTDKLDDELNGAEEWWEVHQIQFLGGRDWVVIYQSPINAVSDDAVYRGTARKPTGSKLWEITIPSMGPNDESLVTHAQNANEIDRMAREAIAVTHNLDPDTVQVDIFVSLD